MVRSLLCFRARSVAARVATFLGTMMAVSSARAAPRAVVNVLEMAADADDFTTAQALTNMLRLRIGDGDDFLLASDNMAFLVAALSVRCDVRGFDVRPLRPEADRSLDPRCLRSVGAHLGAKRYFWGYLYHEPGGRLGIKLHLWSEEQGDRSKSLLLDGGGRERILERLYLHLVHPALVADVRVVANPGLEGELWIDERPQGTYAPNAALTLLAGEHRVEVRSGGKVLARGRANVVAGRASEVRLDVLTRTDVPVANVAPVPIAPPPRPSPLPWAIGGVGAAGLVGAGVLFALHRAQEGDLDDLCRDDVCATRARSALNRSDLYGTLALVSLGVGLAGVSTSGVLFLTDRPRRASTPAPGLHGFLLPQPGGGVATLGGSF